MKLCLIFFSLLFSCHSFSQVRHTDFFDIDRRVITIDGDEPAALAKKLTAPYTSELQKVRSIFSWITSHISYNVPRNNTSRKKIQTIIEDDDTGALKPLNERVAIMVLKRKSAVCDGYAKLFKTLCDYAGIRSEVVSGYANSGRSNSFRSNHSWNAVFIDGAWYLLDVTWAAGYITYQSNEFIASRDEKYFLSSPQVFIQDHYPEDMQWTLLSQPPVLREFKRSPFINGGFIRQRILSFAPSRGTINAMPGDTILIEVQTNNEEKNLVVTEKFFLDTALIATPQGQGNPQSSYSVNGDKVSVAFVVDSPFAEWLNVIFNGEVIMRYRLNMRKDERVVTNEFDK
jgi:hypothetical protein